MLIPWRSSLDVFAQVLRRHGVEPDAVGDVAAAWAAFEEFIQIEIDGIEGPDNDGDGFIAEWGTWSWNDGLPALSFGRLLAVNDHDWERDDSNWQPQYWKLDLQMCFADHPDLAGLDDIGFQDTGFDFYEIGSARAAALVETRAFIQSYPQLTALWRSRPLRSQLTLDQAG
jgi:hypothetical protein